MRVKPTRNELIKLKEKRVLAEKGKDVLKKKAEALRKEVLVRKKEFEIFSKKIERMLNDAINAIDKALMEDGYLAVRSAALNPGVVKRIEIEEKAFFGSTIPLIKIVEIERRKQSISEGIATFIAKEKFSDLLEEIIRGVNSEIEIRFLLEEYKKANRRANAIEKKIIPEMDEEIKRIEDRLEELEREDKIRIRKLFKK